MRPHAPHRSVLVLGPGEHFGRELVERLAREDLAVGILDRTGRNAVPLADLLTSQGRTAIAATADVTDVNRLTATIADMARVLPPLQSVIYNVKVSSAGSVLEIDVDDFMRSVAANVGGALAAIRASSPWLKGPRPSFIITGGGYKDRPHSGKLSLSVAKAALHSLFLSAGEPLRHEGISLRTVIIDGAVRQSGPLFPSDVADVFWSAITHPRQRVFWHRATSSRVPSSPQLPLFAGQRALGT